MKKSELNIGDVILFNNQNNLISKSIRLTQGHAFVHACLVVLKGKKDYLLIEIDRGMKARLIPLSKHKYLNDCTVARYKDIKIDSKKIFYSSILLINLSYAYEQIIDGLINHILKFFFKKWKYKHYFSFNFKTRFICSTLVAYILEKSSNIKFKDWTFVEPEDFTTKEWELFELDD